MSNAILQKLKKYFVKTQIHQNRHASPKCFQLLFDIDPLGYQHSGRQIHIECRYRIVHKFLETKVGRLES